MPPKKNIEKTKEKERKAEGKKERANEKTKLRLSVCLSVCLLAMKCQDFGILPQEYYFDKKILYFILFCVNMRCLIDNYNFNYFKSRSSSIV